MNIDTIHINISSENFNYNYIKDKFDNELKPKYNTYYYNKDTNAISYNHENFVISLTKNKIKCMGSLPKFVSGNNIESLDSEGIKFGLTKLEQDLGISFENSLISRLDSSSTIEMLHKPCEYFKMIIKPHGFKKKTFEDETVYFEKPGTKIMFYDKVVETKKNNLPMIYKNKNLLRYEIQMDDSKFANNGLPSITAHDLYDKNILAKIINAWYHKYQSIPKLSKLGSVYTNFETLNNWKESLIINYISSTGGFDKAISDLNSKAFKKTKYEIKKHLVRLKTKMEHDVVSYDLVKELDQKMLNKYEELKYKLNAT